MNRLFDSLYTIPEHAVLNINLKREREKGISHIQKWLCHYSIFDSEYQSKCHMLHTLALTTWSNMACAMTLVSAWIASKCETLLCFHLNAHIPIHAKQTHTHNICGAFSRRHRHSLHRHCLYHITNVNKTTKKSVASLLNNKFVWFNFQVSKLNENN